MQNYFNYFTEIEEHFQRRRGSILLLSALDWALIETWREAGIPLHSALRGIDEAFDKLEARQYRGRLRRVNGLAWCAQAVLEAVEQQKEALVGQAPDSSVGFASGFEANRILAHLRSAAEKLLVSGIATESCTALAARLCEIAKSVEDQSFAIHSANLETLERQLTVLEEKLFAALTSGAAEDILVRFKSEASRELAPYRSRMSAVQLRQIEHQFVHKRLLEHFQLPRLSLFYMKQA